MKKHALLLIPLATLALLLVPAPATPEVPAAACATLAPVTPGAGLSIELVSRDGVASATIEDSAAGRAFVDSLPVSVQLRDSWGVALVGSLPPGLGTASTPASCLLRPGEIAWSPEASALAIARSPEPTAVAPPGVSRLGEVTNGLDALAGANSPVTIRRG